MYLFGSAILTGIHFWIGRITSQSVEGAIRVAIEFFVAKLTPFPLDEFLTASGFAEVVVNITIALLLGLIVASYKYRRNRY